MTNSPAYTYLISHGVKPSVQRIAIMDYLQENHTHPTVEEIYSALIHKIPTLSKTTVYNTLKLFVEHHAVKMLTIDEKNAQFDADTSTHGHFFCTKCNKVFDFPMNQSILSQLVRIPNSFKVEDTSLYVRGVCEACKTMSD